MAFSHTSSDPITSVIHTWKTCTWAAVAGSPLACCLLPGSYDQTGSIRTGSRCKEPWGSLCCQGPGPEKHRRGNSRAWSSCRSPQFGNLRYFFNKWAFYSAAHKKSLFECNFVPTKLPKDEYNSLSKVCDFRAKDKVMF